MIPVDFRVLEMLTDIHLSIQIFALYICLIYLDDVIVLGRSFEDMVTNLKKVYDRLLAAGFKLKAKKCHLFCKKVVYLGHLDELESAMIPVDF
jgi:hypothetical protein